MSDAQTQLARHLKKLSAEIGARPIGSAPNQAAADYIRDQFRAAGLDVEEQPYARTDWECSAISLEIEGKRTFAAANVFSLPCDVTAPVMPLCSSAELESAPVTGNILLLYGDLANHPLSPKSWFLKSERDDKIIQLLEAKRPAALLAPPAATVEYEQVTEDWELDIPAATIAPETALALINQPGIVAHLRIESRRIPATARNIVARKAGRNGKKVVLMAHFDTKINTPGATDNAGGAAALLWLAESFRDTDLPFGLEFVAFNGEEYLPIGDDEYLRRGESQFGQILLAVNFDGAGAALGTCNITDFNTSHELHALVDEQARRHPAIIWVEPWPESNHSTFSFRGVPALALSSTGVRAIAHSPADTIEQASPAKLADSAQLVKEIVGKLGEMSNK